MPLPTVRHENPYVAVQRLVELPDEEYKAPPPPPFDDSLETFQRPSVPYGHPLKSMLFTLDPTITMLNHGSFGACPKPVQAVRQAYMDLQEFEPVKFVEDESPRLAHVTRVVANYVNAAPRQIVLVPNASAASTSVLRSFPFTAGDVIVSFNLEYGSVVHQIHHASPNLKYHEIQVTAPFSAASILTAFREALDSLAGEKIGMVVVDHITSESGLIMPIEEIIAICKTQSIPILVDGAHAIGHVPLDLDLLQPDFYLSNFHKWILAPKSIAFLYIREPNKYRIVPPIISHADKLGTNAEFSFIGTLDYSAYLSVPASLAFHTKMGGLELMQRNHDLCVKAAQKLAKAWNTKLLTDEVDTMIGSICVVELPHALFEGVDDVGQALLTLHFVLRKHYQIEAKTAHVGDILGLRISVQMYNEQADYDKLEAAVLDILKKDPKELALE
ncbi:unnamed protein product [Aphanomyces euteiches]